MQDRKHFYYKISFYKWVRKSMDVDIDIYIYIENECKIYLTLSKIYK